MWGRDCVTDTPISQRLRAWLVRGLKNGNANRMPVLLLGIVTLGVYAFIQIADEMAEGEIRNLDETLFLMMRVPGDPARPLGPDWLQETALEITAIGGYPLIMLTLAAIVIGYLESARARAYVLGVAVMVAVMVGVSRVYLGVHWPSDVAAGWALGAAWASFTWLIVHMLQRRKARGLPWQTREPGR